MKTLTVLCNIVLFGLTCLIVATEGLPKQAGNIAFTLLMMLIPVFTVFAIVRKRTSSRPPGLHVKKGASEADPITDLPPDRSTVTVWLAGACNVLLLGLVCWALVAQYPYPEKEGAVISAVPAALTPILSVIVLYRRAPSDSQRGPQIQART